MLFFWVFCRNLIVKLSDFLGYVSIAGPLFFVCLRQVLLVTVWFGDGREKEYILIEAPYKLD